MDRFAAIKNALQNFISPPQQKLISPLAGSDTLDTPGLQNYAAAQQIYNQKAAPSNFVPKTIQYPQWMANAKPTQPQQSGDEQYNNRWLDLYNNATKSIQDAVSSMNSSPDQAQAQTISLASKSQQATSSHSSSFDPIISQAATENGVPPELLHALIQQESGFNPNAKSSAGALGIAQFMPDTAKGMGIDPMNPQQAINGAAKYLANSYNKFGSWPLALAAYNAGGGAVSKYGGIPPFPETQNYVNAIMANSGGINN